MSSRHRVVQRHCSPVFLLGMALLLGCSTEPGLVDVPWSLEAAIGRDSTTGATVETDKDDYLPGDTVRISGRGWAANEPVTLFLSRTPATSSDNEWHVLADQAGAFETSFLVVQSDLGVTFNLKATGPESGSVVTVVFTDGNLQEVSLSPASITVAPGEAAVYSANVIMGGTTGACNITLSVVPPVPPQTLAVFAGPNPTSVSPGNISFSRNLTITTNAATAPGTYTFTIRAAEGGTCNSPGGRLTATGTLVVSSGADAPPVLESVGNRVVDEETELTFTATASDEDVSSLGYSLTTPAVGTFPAGAVISSDGEFSWTPGEAQGAGVYRVRVVVTDNGSQTDEEEIEIVVNEVNRAPVLAEVAAQNVAEADQLNLSLTANDPDLPANELTFSLESGAPAGAVLTPSGEFSWTPANGPAVVTIGVRVTDNGTPALSDVKTFTVTVNNVAPSLTGLELPASPIAAGSPVTVSWSFDDPGADTWSCRISWDQGQPFESASYVPLRRCSATRNLPAGVYTVTVEVSDEAAQVQQSATSTIVVFDPNGGSVTGGGWISSPAGALTANASQSKVTFSLGSKYQKGKQQPDGNLELQLHGAGVNFRSTVLHWLVVSGGTAQLKGEGTLQGQAGLYGFMITAIDGSPDQVRVKIWSKTTSALLYDNHPGVLEDSNAATGLGGGSIVVHK